MRWRFFLASYTLCYTGIVTSGIEGSWQVAAYLSNTSNQMHVWTDISVNSISFQYLKLSPLGLEAEGIRWDMFEFDEISVAVETEDGMLTISNIGEAYNHTTGTYNVSAQADAPIDIASVTALYIDGIRIPITGAA